MSDEDGFLRRQAVSKAQYRAKQRRAHPIDVLLVNLDQADGGFVVEDVEMALRAVQQVDAADLRPFLAAKTDSLVRDYVKAALSVKEMSPTQVDPEIVIYLQAMSPEELAKTLGRVQEKLAVERCADVEYWVGMECEIRRLLTFHDFKRSFQGLLDRQKRLSTSMSALTEEHLYKPTDTHTSVTRDRWTFMMAKWMRPTVDFEPLQSIHVSPDLPSPPHSARLLMHIKWTRLNERRHDALNPPPRLPTGLCLLIDYRQFYSEQTPSYDITNGEEEGWRWLTVRAHAKYSALQFRIPSSAWDCSPKHGFRFSFDHGILLLYVRFKRV